MDQCCEETMLLFLQLNKDTHSYDMMAIGESDHRMRGAAKGRTTKAQNCGKIRKKCEIWFQLSRTQTTAGADNRLNGRHMDDPSQRIPP